MTAIINFWKDALGYTAYSAIFGLDVGHVSMQVINDKNPKDEIYISHCPQVKNSTIFLPKSNKYASLQSLIGNSFIQRAKPTSFEKDCDRRGGKPNSKIVISGLDESRIKEFYQKYLKNDLSEKKSQYHFLKNNCCTVLVYFICKGLECSQKNCKFCSPEEYQTDSFFDCDSNIDKLITAFNDEFWSLRAFKYFAKKVKKKTEKNSSVLRFPVRQRNILLPSSLQSK